MAQTIFWLFVVLVIVVFLIWFFQCKCCKQDRCGSTTPAAPLKTEKDEKPESSSQAEEGQGAKPAVLDKADGQPDDLKKINGIGPKIEITLNELGIFHYSQLAAFTEENINWVNDNLNFKGRIQRDNWVDQAKELVKKN